LIIIEFEQLRLIFMHHLCLKVVYLLLHLSFVHPGHHDELGNVHVPETPGLPPRAHMYLLIVPDQLLNLFQGAILMLHVLVTTLDKLYSVV
jgi:hypothetical protein